MLGGTSLMGGKGTHRRHGAGRADHRGHRQWADPVAHLAVLHADRDRADHPRRHLAQHAGLQHDSPLRSAKREGTMSELSPAHVGSGQVMTVRRPDPRRRSRHHAAARAYPERLPLLVEPAGRAGAPAPRDRSCPASGSWASCGMDPFVNLHNCALDDEPLAIAELMALRRGRAGAPSSTRPAAASGAIPRRCVRISQATGLQHRHGGGLLPAILAPAGAGAL